MTEPREPSVQAVVAWRNSPICPMHMDAGGVPAIADCPECVRIGLVAAYAVDFPPNPSEPLWLELLAAANEALGVLNRVYSGRVAARLQVAIDRLNPVAARVPVCGCSTWTAGGETSVDREQCLIHGPFPILSGRRCNP